VPWRTIITHAPTIVETARRLYANSRAADGTAAAPMRRLGGDDLHRAVARLEEREVEQAADRATPLCRVARYLLGVAQRRGRRAHSLLDHRRVLLRLLHLALRQAADRHLVGAGDDATAGGAHGEVEFRHQGVAILRLDVIHALVAHHLPSLSCIRARASTVLRLMPRTDVSHFQPQEQVMRQVRLPRE
jgi:hypothetical protein